MRLVTLLFITAVSCIAQTYTTVQDTLYTAFSGVKFTGTIHLKAQSYTTSDGRTVAAWERDIKVVGGVFSAKFEPSPATIQADYYPVAGSGASWSEYWLIPASVTPVKVKDIRVDTATVNISQIQWSQMAQNNAINGQAIAWNGSNWFPASLVNLSPGANQSITGFWNFAGGSIRLPETTVSALPAAIGSLGKVYIVSDGQNAADCSVGYGAAFAICRSNGTAWVSIGGGQVLSVAGKIGTVTLNTADVTESTNLYFTDTRARNAMTGLYEFPLTFATGLSRSGNSVNCTTANGSTFGCLSSADWNIFNNKQATITGAPGAWPAFGDAALLNVGATAGTVAAGDDARLSDARTPMGSAGGILSGAYPNPGFANNLSFNGKSIDATGATSTIPFQTGLAASLPATCSVGQMYFATDGVTGRQLMKCQSTNTWKPIAYGVDTTSNITVSACQLGQTAFATDAVSGQNWYGCVATNTWAQLGGSGGGSSTANFAQSFTSATTVAVNHNMGSLNPVVSVWDNATPPNYIEPDKTVITDSNNVTVYFAMPQSGKVVVNTATGPQGAAGTVSVHSTTTGAAGSSASVTNSGTGFAAQLDFVIPQGIQGIQGPAGPSNYTSPALSSSTTQMINHLLNTTNVIVQCNTSGAVVIPWGGGNSYTITDANNVAVTFATANTGGTCTVNAGGGQLSVSIGGGLTGTGTTLSPLAIDTSVVPTRLSNTATLTFPSIAQSACNEQTITLTGAAAGDEVMLGPPSDIDQGFVWSAYISIANTVKVRLCKITTGTVTPVAHTWRATIVRSF